MAGFMNERWREMRPVALLSRLASFRTCRSSRGMHAPALRDLTNLGSEVETP